MKDAVNICWFRRDLRLEDNAALYHALRSERPVLCVFVFDTNILSDLEESDARVQFIHKEICRLHEELAAKGSGIRANHATPVEAFEKIVSAYDIKNVFTNRDYESYAIERDAEVQKMLQKHGANLKTYKDQVIFEKSEVVKPSGEPYVVYTPYSRVWRQKVNDFFLKSYPCEKYFNNFYRHSQKDIPSLLQMGFKKTPVEYPSRNADSAALRDYDKNRNFPGTDGTSRIGIHLRFGTVSIRTLARKAIQTNDVYLYELIWREFYMMILSQFPKIGKGFAFKAEFDNIVWRNNENEFQQWCEGKTGYPLVDAGMRQLNETGFMHNRVRMVTASFLSKHLLIDWRWGEAYFAARLLDYEFASNNGGWQWAVGSGCDAAPYFRIFNPTLQAKKFDPEGKYIRKWVPEIESFGYPKPIVDHEYARKRCLEVYGREVRSVKGER